MYFKYKSGFTLMELLVVISIIGILASVVLSSLNEARINAKIAKTLKQLNQIEKAVNLFSVSQDLESWPYFGGGAAYEEYIFERLIDPTDGYADEFNGIDQFLATSPKPVFGGAYSFYNNDLAWTCAGSNSHSSGVSIRLGDAPNAGYGNVDVELEDKIFLGLNDKLDSHESGLTLAEKKACGRVRKGGGSGSIYYLIATDSDDT